MSYFIQNFPELLAETIPEEVQLALAEGAYLPDWSPAMRQCRNSLGLRHCSDKV